MGANVTRVAVSCLEWKLKPRKQRTCEMCVLAKANQKNDNKQVDANKKTSAPNGRWHSNPGVVKAPVGSGIVVPHPNLHLTTDKYNDLKQSVFYRNKAGFVKPMCEQINNARESGRPIACLRQDKAGENKTIKHHCQSADWQLNVKFEYTARATPQRNSPVETRFTAVAARA